MPPPSLPLFFPAADATPSVGLSEPNPRVACVITSPDGEVIAQGHTQQAGGSHAEIMALRAATAAGRSVRGATAYVTLEPCAHHGRTPPCCDALIEAGLGRVVVALGDPNPRVAGQGLARMRAAGIQVDVLPADHPAAQQAHELNIGFFSRMVRGLPWVRLKAAGSLDGRTALPNGVSQWITSPEARADGHAWRQRAGALLTGIGTVLEDDPRLDVRLVPTARQPVRVIVDARLQTPAGARILQPPGVVWIYTAADPTTSAPRRAELQATGATVIDCPGAHGKVDLPAMLRDLAQREVNELHVEAGHKLNGSFLREGLVDELLIYLAPRLLGEGAGLAALGPFDTLDQTPGFEFLDVLRIGPDLRLRARPPGRDRF
jgi:diaminohydroxyphosphoribosylaminopyrimidine deaminase/5-amino-6-(5-phosphoribosylamino)uracil reductase